MQGYARLGVHTNLKLDPILGFTVYTLLGVGRQQLSGKIVSISFLPTVEW